MGDGETYRTLKVWGLGESIYEQENQCASVEANHGVECRDTSICTSRMEMP